MAVQIPDKPYAADRVISTRITPEMHRKLREAATEIDRPVATVIKTALQQYLASARH